MISSPTRPGHSADVMCIKSILNDQSKFEHVNPKEQRRRHLDVELQHSLNGRNPSTRNKMIQINSMQYPRLHSAEMLSNVSAGNTTSRKPRPKYSPEQEHYIWYHRIVLGESWDVVLEGFQRRYRTSRPKSGLQCKFYRVLDEFKTKNPERLRISTNQNFGEEGTPQRPPKPSMSYENSRVNLLPHHAYVK